MKMSIWIFYQKLIKKRCIIFFLNIYKRIIFCFLIFRNTNNGQEIAKLILNGSLVLNNNNSLENLKKFFNDYKLLISEIF